MKHKQSPQVNWTKLLKILPHSLTSLQIWLIGFLILIPLLPQLAQAATAEENGFVGALDAVFSRLVEIIGTVLFFEIAGIPFIVLWLIGGAIFFTIRFAFINVRGLQTRH